MTVSPRRAAPGARPPIAVAAVAGVLAFVLVACSSGGSGTPPPSGANCAVADAQNHVGISAKNIQFSAPCIEATAGAPIVITFTNQEAVPHDIAVYTDASKKQELIRSDIITGPDKSTSITVPAQQPGQLYFQCTIHSAMNGALVVRAAGSGGASGTPAPSGS